MQSLLNASFDIIKLKTERCIMARNLRIDTKDITGMKFGDLTALYITKSGKYRGKVWKCICDCGNECDVYGGHLRNEMRKSCGCRSQKRIFEVGINRIFAGYKRMASRRNHTFSLTREEFEKLVTANCFYCGSEPGNELKRLKSKKLQIKYNGIDRFNTDKGYITENCVPCCYYCNHGKADLTFEQWMNHVKRIYLYKGISSGI